MATVRGVLRCSVYILIALIPITAAAQIAGPNINMVSGTQFGTGDPFLQRQNEGSTSPSTRNAMHLLGGANDYRTVDLPGLPDGEETGDAWLGLFKSFDGGNTWTSTLIPGYPQDTSPEGLASPLHQTLNGITFPAAADPMVRSGLFGMFYYSGLAITRTNPPVGAVFVARFNDFNNREGTDPIQYLGTTIVADGRPLHNFFDKPSLFADVPRPGASLCSVGGQFILAGNVYVVYTAIEMSGNTTTAAKLWFSRSTNCGSTWSNPILISGSNTLNQGSVMAVDTWSGTLYVVWRRFASGAETNAILVAKSIDGGVHFSAPVVIRSITPFEQGTTPTSFRTSAYPTAVTDANGRLYVAWSERTGPSGSMMNISDKPDGRIMLSSSPDGNMWSTPVMPVPTTPISPLSGRGHQFMPALSYASGKLMLAYYDLRDDSTIGHYSPSPLFTETRFLLGDLASSPQNLDNVFNNFIQDASITGPLKRRHTLDIRASQANPGPMPVFENSQRVSRYRFGSTLSDSTIRQLDFNPPNFKMFKQGSVPFFGDYIDLVPQYPFLSSILNLPFPAPVFFAVWTDNRDVRPPLDGNWANYTPVAVFGGASRFDPTKTAPVCTPGQTGMRNQNIYSSRVTEGLFFGSPGNVKPLGRIQRAFVVTVQNAKTTPQSYRLQIFNQPFGGKASFQQLPLNAPALTTLDITINAKSSASRSVFVTSMFKNPPVGVVVTEIPAVGGTPAPGALTSATVLNLDPTTPDIASPDVGAPDVGAAEVYTPDVGAPDVGAANVANPDVGAPDVGAPDVGAPDVGAPDVGAPDVGAPDVGAPDVGAPDVGAIDLANGSVTDTTWQGSDDGNTIASYTVKLLQTAAIPPGLKLQLILHQTYSTPVARDCVLTTEKHMILLANVPNPTVLTSTNGIGNPDVGAPSVPTVAIAPHQPINITVRVVDPFHKNRIIPAFTFLTPVLVAHAVNTLDLGNPNPQPQISMVITTPSLPDGVRTVSYPTSTLTALFGFGALAWSAAPIFEGAALPPGLTLNPSTGAISGTPTQNGTYTFTVTVHDSSTPRPHTASRVYTIHISNPLAFTTTGLPAATQGAIYNQTLASSGGLAPIHWSLFSGSLPTGMTLGDDGTISGTSPTIGTSNFQVLLTDSSQPAQTLTSPSIRLDVIAPPTGCGPTVTLLFDNWNTQAVSNGGTSPSFSTSEVTYCLDSISDYHWNGGAGFTPGTIGLIGPNQQLLGPWQAVGTSGQGGAPNVNWTARPPAGAPVLLNGTYTVNDSSPNTWSQNAASNQKGFSRVYVRSYTPPTYTVQGRLKYNGVPTTPTTTPNFFLRNEDTGLQQSASINWTGNTFTISGLPAGNFGVEVSSKEGATALFFPGGFYSFTVFNSVSASDGGFDVTLTRLIRLTAPNDNAKTFGPIACPTTLLDVAPSFISWDAIDVAATYNWQIQKLTCSFTNPQTVASGSTTGTAAEFSTLAPTAPGEFYLLTLYAYVGQTFVGQIMTNFTNGHGWDLRFIVPASGTWTARASTPAGIRAHAVASANGMLYSVGGEIGAPTFAYDPGIDRWTTKTAMPTPQIQPAAGVVNGIIYVAGGGDGVSIFGTTRAYDPINDQWTTKTPMPTSRAGHAIGVINGVLYAVGGYANGVFSTVEAYDPATDSWTTKTSMPTARHQLGVAVVGGILYAIGGLNSDAIDLATVEAYDPSTNQWTTKTSMPTARSDFGVAAANGIIYVFGGANHAVGLSTVEAYNPATDTWSTVASMPTARSQLAGAELGGLIYAVGGHGADSTPLSVVEAYRP